MSLFACPTCPKLGMPRERPSFFSRLLGQPFGVSYQTPLKPIFPTNVHHIPRHVCAAYHARCGPWIAPWATPWIVASFIALSLLTSQKLCLLHVSWHVPYHGCGMDSTTAYGACAVCARGRSHRRCTTKGSTAKRLPLSQHVSVGARGRGYFVAPPLCHYATGRGFGGRGGATPLHHATPRIT